MIFFSICNEMFINSNIYIEVNQGNIKETLYCNLLIYIQLWLQERYKYPCLSNFQSLTIAAMGKMVSGLLVALFLQGLTANQGLENGSNPTVWEKDIHVNTEKFVARGNRVYLVQPPWLVKLIHDKYRDLENHLVMKKVLTIMTKRVFFKAY